MFLNLSTLPKYVKYTKCLKIKYNYLLNILRNLLNKKLSKWKKSIIVIVNWTRVASEKFFFVIFKNEKSNFAKKEMVKQWLCESCLKLKPFLVYQINVIAAIVAEKTTKTCKVRNIFLRWFDSFFARIWERVIQFKSADQRNNNCVQ